MIATDHPHWRCPACRSVLPFPSLAPIVCACGHRDEHPDLHRTAEPLAIRRQASPAVAAAEWPVLADLPPPGVGTRVAATFARWRWLAALADDPTSCSSCSALIAELNALGPWRSVRAIPSVTRRIAANYCRLSRDRPRWPSALIRLAAAAAVTWSAWTCCRSRRPPP